MSKDYVVALVHKPLPLCDIDGSSAQIFMRFYEMPTDEFMKDLATVNPSCRVYCLSGASAWFQTGDL